MFGTLDGSRFLHFLGLQICSSGALDIMVREREGLRLEGEFCGQLSLHHGGRKMESKKVQQWRWWLCYLIAASVEERRLESKPSFFVLYISIWRMEFE